MIKQTYFSSTPFFYVILHSHGLSIAEFALSVLQLAEIPIIRLVPRLPAIKKGQLEYINFAGFSFDKESITPIIEALNEVKCILNTMKISIGSLINLDFESCKLMGRILKDARVRVFVSRTFSLLHIKNLFEEMDDDHNGYLDQTEFLKALKSLNSGLLYMDEKRQKRIFQKLAIRRIKERDRVYFYDFFKNTASVENKEFGFDITQMDYPLHYIFQHLISETNKLQNVGGDIKKTMESMKKLYYFCCGLENFNQIDRSINNHIFFTIIDTLNTVDGDKKNNSHIIKKFVMKCFHEILESDIIVNNALGLLSMRNNLFERDIDDDLYKQFVMRMYNDKENNQCEGLNIFEYCFAFKDESEKSHQSFVFVHLLNLYLKTRNQYLSQQNENDTMRQLFDDKDGALYYLYKASKFKWSKEGKLPIEYAAKHGLFEVVEFFSKYLIIDYSEDELYNVCVELLRNEENQNPETFEILLQNTEKNGMHLVNMKNRLNETMDILIMKTQKNIERKEIKQTINTSESNEIYGELLRYFEILNEFGFDFSKHSTLNEAIDLKNDQLIKKIIQLCQDKSNDCINRLLNEISPESKETPIMNAYSKKDLSSIEYLLQCDAQDCDEIFNEIQKDLKLNRNKYLWIKFIYDVIINEKNKIDNILNRIAYEHIDNIYKTLKNMLDNDELEDDAMPGRKINVSRAVTGNKQEKSMMKNILRFGGLFGNKNKFQPLINALPTAADAILNAINENDRVSFKAMAVRLCGAINANLSKRKPASPPAAEEQEKVMQIKDLEVKEEETMDVAANTDDDDNDRDEDTKQEQEQN